MWIVLAVLLVCSALLSGSEVAYFSLNPTELEELKEAKTGQSRRILSLLDRPKNLLATILIGNNFVNVGIILLSNNLIESRLPTNWAPWLSLTVSIGGITFILLMLGEVIPKVYAAKFRLSLARMMTIPLVMMRQVFWPISWALIKSTNVIDRKIKKKDPAFSVDELGTALELTSDENTTEEEHKMLKGIVRFGSTDVKQIMRPRTDIVAFEWGDGYNEVIETIVQTGFSRIPVYKESFDHVAGILYIKDLLNHLDEEKDFNWQDLVRSPFFVPENKKIDDLLKEFQEKKIHLAVVVDEYGGTSGIVTLEDILEEIIGEISDEFDDDDLSYSKLDNHNYVFEGKTALNDMYRVLDIEGEEFEEEKGDSETLAGFMLELFGKIPLKNERIHFLHYTFTIEAADRRRVKRIKVTIQD